MSITFLTACSNVPAAFGPTPAAARANAVTLLDALQGRFTNVYRTPRYAHAQEALRRNVLRPSAVYNDTSIWTSTYGDGTHIMFGDGAIVNGRYVFRNTPSATPLDAPGDGRHHIRLHPAGDDDYEWTTAVEFAIGTITAQDFANVVSQWLASAEGHTETALRADYRAAFPRTASFLGQLLTLDTLISVPDTAGGNTVYLGMRVTTAGIRGTYPNYAKFLDKYAKRAKISLTLDDHRGARWCDAALRNGRITIRMRSRDGHFAPLDGTLRAIPDTLMLRMEVAFKVGIFTVGANEIAGEWVNLAMDHERGWAMRFTREPKWNLPPTVGTLLRSSLRRPFQGEGVQFRISIRDTPGRQTLIVRRARLSVRESAILRFLNKLSGTTMGDFETMAAEEENRFNAALFTALRTDMDAAFRGIARTP